MSWTEVQEELNKLEQKKVQAAAPSELPYVEGLAGTVGHTFGEMIGVEKPPEIKKWEAEHPYAAFGAELATWALPLGLWGKAAGPVIKAGTKALAPKAPAVAKTLDGIMAGEKILEKPFKAGMAREIVRFAPFEAGRVAGGAIFGEALAEHTGGQYIGTGQLATEAAAELALFGIGAGAFESFAAAGKRTLGKIYPGADLSAPPQIQLRQMAQSIAEGRVVDQQQAIARMRELARDVRLATPQKGKYVTEIEMLPTGVTQGKKHPLNRWLRPKIGQNKQTLQFSHSVKGATFKDRVQQAEIERRVGFPEGYEAFVQHPRYVQGLTRQNQRHIDRDFQKNMYGLDTTNGWFFNKDKSDGLFIMAKKLDKGEWVTFKTDTPSAFVPEYGKFVEKMQQRAGVFGGEPKFKALGQEGTEIWDTGIKLGDDIKAWDLRDTDIRKGGPAKVVENIIERTGLGAGLDKGSAAYQGLGNFVSKVMAPTMFQFKNPLARKGYTIARSLADRADGIAEAVFLGRRGLKAESGSLYREILGGAVSKGGDTGLKGMIASLHKNPGQWEAVWKTVNTQAGIDEGIKLYGLADEGIAFLRKMEAIDKWQIDGLNAVQKAAGEKLLEAKANHFMISRTWNGDWRVPVYEGKKVIGYASGHKRGHAIQEAQDIVAEGANAGAKLKVGDPALVGELRQDLVNLRNIDELGARKFGEFKDAAWVRKSAPKRATEKRKGLGGYVGATRPWTQDELEHIVYKQLQDYQKLQAKISTQAQLKGDLDLLRLHEPDTYEQLVQRINQIHGEQGTISRAINETVDIVMAPVLGKNSASKIIGAANKWMFRWTLGFANMGYNMANMLTFVQTAYPQIAFLTTAAPEAISKYYTYWPVAGAKAVDGMGVLDIMKLTKQTFKKMGDPDPLLRKHFERGAQEGVWDPRFVEEFVGKNSARVTNLRGVATGEESFSEWFGAVADALPGVTEKFSRGQAFVMGHTLFRDIFRIEDDELLYQMAKQFTEKTQFLYASSDRANIITGPMGSAAGLFKNWVMHYIGWMAEYTGEAFYRGNWKPMMYMMGGTGTIGGLGALPLYGAANQVSEWMSDKSIMQHTYERFGAGSDGLGAASDMVFYGLPASLGFSIQNQVSAPGVDFGQDAARMFSLAYIDRMTYAQKAFGQAVDYWGATGNSPVRDARTRDLMMRAFAPKMMYRMGQSIEDRAIKSLGTGYPVTELDTMGRMMYAAGVNPLALERTYAVSQELWTNRDKEKAAITKYGSTWAEAAAQGDHEELRNIINRAVLEGVDVSSVIKSGKAILAKGKEDMINRTFSPEAILPYRKAGIIQ